MKKPAPLKLKIGSLVFLFLLPFFLFNLNLQPVRATVPAIPTIETVSVPLISVEAKNKLKEKIKEIWNKFGANLVSTTLQKTVNRIAIDAAKYVATAGEGQKPLFIVEDFSEYWKNIGDAAAGDFIDGLGDAWGQVDLCQPPSPEIQAKIGLGLVQTLYPETPNCTLSSLIHNYSSAYEKLKAMETGDFLKGIKVSFDPGGSELSTAMTLFGRVAEVSSKAEGDEIAKTTITQGWLDVRNIAGNRISTPNEAKSGLEQSRNIETLNFFQKSGDILVDAANVFLNQLAYEGFQRVLREINNLKSTSEPLDISRFNYLSNRPNSFEGLINSGETVLSEKLASVINPSFGIKTDYSILSELAICPSLDNPGPNNCVIDDSFSQAIADKLTVGEALKEGYLHGSWQITADYKNNSAYSLRSASILRKYRIVPLSWEEVFSYIIEHNKKATFEDLVSCFSDSDNYKNFSTGFDKENTDWCKGMIDPDWVLKAPLNYCAKEGYGSQIISSYSSPEELGESSLMIMRAGDYCADNQTCIKESSDGSCELYGYCNEERQTWSFNTDTCQPVFNTCQTFTNTNSNKPVSFLMNTLDYSSCDANNVGCREYYPRGTYSNGSLVWNKEHKIFLNNNAPACESNDEGCTQFLRGKPGWTEVNYIMDSNFSLNEVGDTSEKNNWHWPIRGITAVSPQLGEIVNDAGRKALKITGLTQVGLYSDLENSVLPQNMQAISAWAYTLSAEVKITAEANDNRVVMTFGDPSQQVESTSKEWTQLSITLENTNVLDFSLIGYGRHIGFEVRNLKLTPNGWQTNFSNYGKYPVYQKLLPSYLESECYVSAVDNNYSLKDEAPAICFNYARRCSWAEVGCDIFSATTYDFSLAAKVGEADYCDQQCSGYNSYIAKEVGVFSATIDNIIPETATRCAASEVGCASFTNLDRVEQGGEELEYYSQLRQCIKPGEAPCGAFYFWKNSQLELLYLRQNSDGLPYLTDPESVNKCNERIYNLPVSDPRYNPDCRLFYNVEGKESYRLFSETVTCSENCNSYRLNTDNYDLSLVKSDCTGNDRNWNDFYNACQVCENGGLWNSQQGACVYKAIPQEGKSCSATSVGCREYNGARGNVSQRLQVYDFEEQTDFTGYIYPISDSLFEGGQSLVVQWLASSTAPYVKEGAAYTLKFLAKPLDNQTTSIRFSFVNIDDERSVFGVSPANYNGDLELGEDWQIYEVSLDALDHFPNEEYLEIEVSSDVIIDNLIISEITDRYYLKKGSSLIPDVCFYDINDVYRGPNYNLGCSQYYDRARNSHYLRQFNELCKNSSVGCELMVQTYNNSNFFGFSYDQEEGGSCQSGNNCYSVPGNEVVYMIFDSSKQCNKEATGCTRLGTEDYSSGQVFKRLLPDTYLSDKSPLCLLNEVGCDAWFNQQGGGSSYFKNPGTNTCIYSGGKWLETSGKRCDLNNDNQIDENERNGAACSSDQDCEIGKCLIDESKECLVNYETTLGMNGLLASVPKDKVALCSAESSGCTEYIDPISKQNNNLLLTTTESWTLSGSKYSQEVTLKPNTLYTLSVDSDSSVNLRVFTKDNNSKLRSLNSDNSLSAPVQAITVSNNHSIFYAQDLLSSSQDQGIAVIIDTTNKEKPIYLREVIINYQLKGEVDLKSCNGLVNADNGCLLFNERSLLGASGLKSNIYNALTTNKGDSPKPGGTANQIIKVQPDRVCSNWLSCQTYVEDPVTKEKVCYKVSECNELDDKNECSNFVSHTDLTREEKSSATGYALLNKYYLGEMKEVGGHAEAAFTFESGATALSCRRDIGVFPENQELYSKRNQGCSFDKSINEDSLILSPKDATTDYPANDLGYLKVLNYYQISPHADSAAISVSAGKTYFINYLINTKNSNYKAKLVIVDAAQKTSYLNHVVAAFTDEAPNGWERKVKKFTAPSSGQIQIFLTSDTKTLDKGYVYFDDIYIEPVLQVGENEYVAKECRLYPGEDSHSCLSANHNVIKDGLYGYCLERDPANPKVCQLWYPVDGISPVGRVYKSESGYSGKFPLYYCTEADGNFSFVEKVKAVKMGSVFGIRQNFSGTFECGASNDGCGECRIMKTGCYTSEELHKNPRAEQESELIENKNIGSGDTSSSSSYWTIYAKGDYDASPNAQFLKVLCIPNQDDLKLVTGTYTISDMNACNGISYQEGWVPYDGKIEEKQGSVYGASNEIKKICYKLNFGDFDPWCDSDKFILNQKDFHHTPIAVYNELVKPLSEADLKYPYGQTDPFQITCNKFSQFVNNQGESISWTGRIGVGAEDSSMPAFFNSRYEEYSRSREGIPFGSAIFPDNFSLERNGAVYLRNQYSKNNNESAFAGRPYGCSLDSNGNFSSGCENIGYCRYNKNIYCLYREGDEGFNKLTCSASGGGICDPLWSSVPSESSAMEQLNNLFMKKYGDWKYNPGMNIYEVNSAPAALLPFSQLRVASSHSPSSLGFIVKPNIDTAKVKLINSGGNNELPQNGQFNIAAGLYRLDFNTKVDLEQQPLKRIIIDWGDDTMQSMGGLDQRPNAHLPHKFYHYYASGNYKIKIKIEDNWGAWRCIESSASSWKENTNCGL